MEILVRKRDIDGGQMDAAAATSTSFEVPNFTIAKLSALVGVIITVIQTLTSLLTTWVVDIPRGRAQIELGQAELGLVERNFKLQMLQRVLEDEDANRRANSLKLLIATGMLSDPDGEIKRLAETSGNIPIWKERALESLKETLPLVRGAQQASETAPPRRSADGNSNASSKTNTNTNTNRNTNPVDPPKRD